MPATPVRKGGWCIRRMVGRPRPSARRSASQASRSAQSAPPPSPGITVSSAIEPNREVVDAVVLEPDRRQVGMACAQDRRKVLAAVMISGDHEHRHRQRREAVADDLVLLGEAAIGEVAGDDDAVGLRHERGDGRDGAPERRLGIDGAVGQAATRPDMGIGDVGEDHGRKGARSPALRHGCYFISALVSATSLSRPSCGGVVPRITALMISRCVRQMRTELPPG